MEEQLDEIRFKAGQMVKIDGIPFFLKEDTTLLGHRENLKLTYCTLDAENRRESGSRQFFGSIDSSD